VNTAVQWVVFAERSSDVMVAIGITDKPSAARWIVEAIMADTSNAGWGEVLRVPVPGEAPPGPGPGEWPPPGEVFVCRRDTRGGYKWPPLFPAGPDSARQEPCQGLRSQRVLLDYQVG
jgi:hypothetical protein